MSDIRHCLLSHLIKERKRDRLIGQSLIQNHLNPIVLESLGKPSDLLAEALESKRRFGQRLVKLVTLISKAVSATTVNLSSNAFTDSRLAPPLVNPVVQDGLSVEEKLGLFCVALYPLSHPYAGREAGTSLLLRYLLVISDMHVIFSSQWIITDERGSACFRLLVCPIMRMKIKRPSVKRNVPARSIKLSTDLSNCRKQMWLVRVSILAFDNFIKYA